MPNVLSVVRTGESDSSSFLSVSTSPPHRVSVPLKEASPPHTPHLYWKCSVGSDPNGFPIMFEALIDHRSSAALISDKHVTKLSLCCKCLHEPYNIVVDATMQSHTSKFSNTFYCKCHKGKVYIGQ